MHCFSRRTAAALLTLLLTMHSVQSPAQAPPALKQYVDGLRVAPRLHDPKAWTPSDNAAVAERFKRLEQATAAGPVILARRTDEALEETSGLVVFEAASAEAATALMQGEPAVVAGVMSAILHPYAVALLRN